MDGTAAAFWSMKKVMEPTRQSIDIDGASLAVARWGRPADSAVVMLHEGLGSITQWRDLPLRIHQATGATVYAYDRAGYGRSEGEFPSTYRPDFMHHEALDILPRLLEAMQISKVTLFGHSDGASIALIAAAESVAAQSVGVVAPHVHVEEVCLQGIQTIASQRDAVVRGLGRHHTRPDVVFDRWRDIWLDPEFAAWNIEDVLPHVTAPIVAAQGRQDEYATDAMIELIVENAPNATGGFFDDCGHVAHRDQPDAVLRLAVEAVDAGQSS